MPPMRRSRLICAPICLQWFMRANWRRFGVTFLFNPAAPEIPLKHAPHAAQPPHLCPHLFAMVYEGELAAVWGHIFVQSGRAGDPAEACPTDRKSTRLNSSHRCI